jgi:outer membrane protein OmpA-like peptidoglycan-associated protein
MKKVFKSIFLLMILIIYCGAFSGAYADRDFGSSKVTAEDIINEFKDDDQEPEKNTIDLSGQTRSLCQKTRSLGVSCETTQASDNPSRKKPTKFVGSPTPMHEPVATRAKKPQSPVRRCEQKSVSMEVRFDYKSDLLTHSAMEQLRPLGEALASEKMTDFSFLVEGHTDAVGGEVYNQDLSLRRAVAVKKFLTNQFEFKGKSLEVVGKGKYGLADPANPASEKNRRVKIVKLGCS